MASSQTLLDRGVLKKDELADLELAHFFPVQHPMDPERGDVLRFICPVDLADPLPIQVIEDRALEVYGQVLTPYVRIQVHTEHVCAVVLGRDAEQPYVRVVCSVTGFIYS